MVPFQICSFGADPSFRMAARGDNVSKMVEISQIVSETTNAVVLYCCRNVPWMVLYQFYYCGANRNSKMAAGCFWLVETKCFHLFVLL